MVQNVCAAEVIHVVKERLWSSYSSLPLGPDHNALPLKEVLVGGCQHLLVKGHGRFDAAECKSSCEVDHIAIEGEDSETIRQFFCQVLDDMLPIGLESGGTKERIKAISSPAPEREQVWVTIC